MPFDRMIRAVDTWAAESGRGAEVFAQVGRSEYVPQHFPCVDVLTPSAYAERCRAARLIVAHAGMGSIITAAEYGKPLLVMPRRGDLRETRNDHQVHTARWLAQQGRVMVAMDEFELTAALTRGVLDPELSGTAGSLAPQEMIDALRRFVFEG